MDWTHLKPSEGRLMPWKNGGGTTLELAADPPGATLETGFRWRLSSAVVAASGPFSAFPGLERWLLLLEGAGMDLDFGHRGRMALPEPLRPLRFSGDWPAVATLLDGPCTDLNLMVDPRTCRSGMEVVHLGASQTIRLSEATTLLFVAQGAVAVPALNLQLGSRHLLRLDGGAGDLALAPGLGGAALVRMDLIPV
jgi:environmental stress-induced protein Ves